MDIINKSDFSVTNTLSEILVNTRWGIHETKVVLIILRKLYDFRVFLRKDKDGRYSTKNNDLVIEDIDSNNLGTLISDIPTTFTVLRDEFISVTSIDSSHAAREIKKVCDKLIDKKSNTASPLDPKNPKSFRLLNWFTKIEYVDKEGLIYFDLNPHIIKYLVILVQYTELDFLYISQIDNEYALHIYLQCKILQKKYRGRIENKSRKIISSIEDFKKNIHLDGKYQKISMFKTGVLDVIHDQINNRTDLDYNYSLIKSGNKYRDIAITFSNKFIEKSNVAKDIGQNIGSSSENKLNEFEHSDIIANELNSFGISLSRAQNIIDNYSPSTIYNAIDALKTEIKKGVKINNIAGYLVKCIQNIAMVSQPTSESLLENITQKENCLQIEKNNRSERWDTLCKWIADNEEIINKLYNHYKYKTEDVNEFDMQFMSDFIENIKRNQDLLQSRGGSPIENLLVGVTNKYRGTAISMSALNRIIFDLFTKYS